MAPASMPSLLWDNPTDKHHYKHNMKRIALLSKSFRAEWDPTDKPNNSQKHDDGVQKYFFHQFLDSLFWNKIAISQL